VGGCCVRGWRGGRGGCMIDERGGALGCRERRGGGLRWSMTQSSISNHSNQTLHLALTLRRLDFILL